jgi:hypothetical protein
MWITLVDSKKTKELVRAKVVRIISTDHELFLKSDQLALHLNGKSVKVALRILYEHEKTAERSMRVVYEKMKTKKSELPYNLHR